MSIINYVSFYLFPGVCGICGRSSNLVICNKCKIQLNKELIFKKEKLLNKRYNNLYYVCKYQGIIRKRMIQYKFNNKAYFRKLFELLLINLIKKNVKIENYDIIIPVPIGKKRLKERGYNQVSLLLKNVSKNFNINVDENVLVKSKDTISQSKLDKSCRNKNLVGVYTVINSQNIENKRILLVDDIYTTGATVNECSKELIKYAKKIDVLVIAKD